MLFTIERARLTLPHFWIIVGGNNAIMLGLFLFPLFQGQITTHYLLMTMAFAAGIGFFMGAYLMYRTEFGSKYALAAAAYFLLVSEFMMGGGVVAMATQIVGRPDLRWLAFILNSICMATTLLAGMCHETKSMRLFAGDATHGWQNKIEKYIDYPARQVHASLTSSDVGRSGLGTMLSIIAAGTANIPLLFELYGGGRNNTIYLVVPVLAGTFAYVNFKTIGPGLVRLLLLRRLEKKAGRRFVNADLKQIQELRCNFFLSRWLMKDFGCTKPLGAGKTNKMSKR